MRTMKHKVGFQTVFNTTFPNGGFRIVLAGFELPLTMIVYKQAENIMGRDFYKHPYSKAEFRDLDACAEDYLAKRPSIKQNKRVRL